MGGKLRSQHEAEKNLAVDQVLGNWVRTSPTAPAYSQVGVAIAHQSVSRTDRPMWADAGPAFWRIRGPGKCPVVAHRVGSPRRNDSSAIGGRAVSRTPFARACWWVHTLPT